MVNGSIRGLSFQDVPQELRPMDMKLGDDTPPISFGGKTSMDGHA
jgi:hypothetical protein